MAGCSWGGFPHGGIFCEHGNYIQGDFGSQTLIIITATVITDKLLIMFMEVHGLVEIWVVFFTLTICCRSMHTQVLQTTVIYDKLFPYTICSRMLSNSYRKFIIIIMQDTGTLIKIIGLFIAVVGLGNLTRH